MGVALMSIMLNSKGNLESKWQEVIKLRKESDSIRSTFKDKEIDISDYMSKSMIGLMFTDIFTIVFAVIIASLVLAVSSFIGLGWLVGIVYIIALIGLLFLFFVPIALISSVFIYLTYFDGTPSDEAAYTCVILFVLYRLTTIFNRKQKAMVVKNNVAKERRLITEINNILDEELIPIAHEKYIISIETIKNDADIGFLPDSVVSSLFNRKAKDGVFEKVLSFDLSERRDSNGKPAEIFKSLLNSQPSSEFVEVIELDIV